MRVLAFDLGASSGRGIIAELKDGKITLNEIHRFENNGVNARGTLYWDILYLFNQIKQGIVNAKLAGGFDSIGIDTWGVDFGLIDENGDLHIFEKPDNAAIEAFEGTPINGFTFGPGLIVNGEVRRHDGDHFYAGSKPAQRMCLAQVGPLEYLCICSEGPEDPGSTGMTLDQFTDLVASFEGVQNAYNLDGGSSSTMVFQNQKINSPNNPKRRPLCDIIYFASAWME